MNHKYLVQKKNNNVSGSVLINLSESEIVVGRSTVKALSQYPAVSRQHARFNCDEAGNVYVTDLNSSNGIFVNGIKIGKSIKPLHIGDVIGFGEPSVDPSNGFVCILKEKLQIKHEIIEIDDSDSEDNFVPEIIKNASQKSNAVSSCNESSEISLKNQSKVAENVKFVKNDFLPEVTTNIFQSFNSGSSSNASIKANVKNESKISEDIEFVEKRVIPEVTITKFQKPDLVLKKENFVGEYSMNASQTSCVPSNVNLKKELNKCFVVLTKCDSVHFEWPADVKNVLREQDINKKRCAPLYTDQTKHKRIKSFDSAERDSIQNLSSFSHSSCKNRAKLNVKNISMTVINSKNMTETTTGDAIFTNSAPLNEAIHCPVSPNRDLICDNDDEANIGRNKRISSQGKLEKSTDSDEEVGAICYSQHEEIIILSDEESYFDFSSSQHCKIKEESPDVQEDIDNLDKDIKEIFEVPDSVLCIPDDNESIENMDAISAFINSSAKREHVEENMLLDLECITDDKTDDTDSSDSEILCSTKITLGSSLVGKSSQVNGKLPTRSNVNAMLDFSASRKKDNVGNKSFGRILLTDPKPMQQRPRKVRGREEGFMEQTKYKHSNSPVRKSVECSKKPSKSVSRKEFSKDVSKTGTKLHLRKHSMELQFGKKNSSLNSFKIPRKPSVENKEMENGELNSTGKFQTLAQDHRVLTVTKKFPNKVSEPEKRKTSSVKVRPEKFGSRMAFLTNEIATKQSAKPKSENTFKNSTTISSSAVQNRNLMMKHISATTVQKTEQNEHMKNKNNSQQKTKVMSQVKNDFPVKEIFLNLSKSTEINHNLRSLYEKSMIDTSVNNTSASNIVQKNPAPLNLRDPRLLNRSASDAYTDKSKAPLGKNSHNPSSIVSPHSRAENDKIVRSDSLNSEFNFLFLVKELIKMNTSWLQEQEKMKFPPPSVQVGAADLPLYFKSFEEYVSLFLPMIRLEIWESMYQESREVFRSNKSANKFYFSLISCISKNDCIELVCESIVSEKVSYCPREGTIAILELKESRSKRMFPFFGYIFKHSVSKLSMETLKCSTWKHLPKEWIDGAHHWTFRVYIRKKDMPFALGSLMKANGICYIRSKLRLVDALSNLKNSSLLHDILKPRLETCKIQYCESIPTKEYSSSQMKAIKGISHTLQEPITNPKIILLQGPPGTGKTHTIIGLIQKLLYEDIENPKLLVVAPSNAAIDEIGCRLIDLIERNRWTDKRIRFVRIGSKNQIHPDIVPYFLDKNAFDLHYHNLESEDKRLNKEINKVKSELTQLANGMDSYQQRNLKQRLQYLEKQKTSVQQQLKSKKMDYPVELANKISILKHCHIVLSTLNSCGLSVLTKTFKPHSSVQFSCCIVDETTQCTEVEILQPLVFGIKKLILVGDHKQLPATVTSKVACKHGFERSMFERFHIFFKTYHHTSPVFTLTEQFRMHSEICAFPSKQFYDSKLVTDPDVDVRYTRYKIKPYVLLNIMDSQETNDSSSKINVFEASVIVNICKCLLLEIDSPTGIGIITPYQSQRTLYAKALHQNPNYRGIEINTVDGFQGREKEIIIMSCVRANSQSGGIGFLSNPNRLNVAITRAKKSLIICCHAYSLMKDPEWRELINDAHSRQVFVNVTSAEEIFTVFKSHIIKKSVH